VNGDPVNYHDPTGLYGDGGCDPDEVDCIGDGGCDPEVEDCPCTPPGQGFNGDPGPGGFCPVGGGPPPPKQQPPPPTCSLELEYTGVKSLGRVVNHAALVVDDSFGYMFTMQGFPQHTLPPWGNLVAQNTPGNIGDTQWGNVLTSKQDPSLCSQISSIETAENFYSKNEVEYYGWGPNSNSLINWLLESGDVNQYFTQPPLTPGWNTPLYSQKIGGVF
jgi:hypothetical protein